MLGRGAKKPHDKDMDLGELGEVGGRANWSTGMEFSREREISADVRLERNSWRRARLVIEERTEFAGMASCVRAWPGQSGSARPDKGQRDGSGWGCTIVISANR